MVKQKDIKSNGDILKEVVEVKDDYKIEQCKVFFIKNNLIAIDFKGYGIQINIKDLNMDLIDKFIEVKYTSDIGKPDFHYWI
jgi:hypothetical protein